MPRLEYLDLSGLALTELDLSRNLELTYLVAGKSFMGVITQLTLPLTEQATDSPLTLHGSPSARPIRLHRLGSTLMVSYSESLSGLRPHGPRQASSSSTVRGVPSHS